MEKIEKEKRCILCNKPYNYDYQLFGRECLRNVYDLLDISYPIRLVKDKEMYLCNRIALRNYKFFLGKEKKYVLAEKYIALKYLDKIESDFFNELKDKISKDIRNISIFRRNFIEILPFKLNDVYLVYNEINKCKNLINEFQSLDLEKIDQKVAEETLKRMSFIFDVNKKTNPITYVSFYLMQYMFWQLVVVGGLLTNMKLSAKLLSNSLIPLGDNVKDLIIEDDETINIIKDSVEFKQKIRELIEKYGNEETHFCINDAENLDTKINFNNKDLFLAIHGATIYVDATKNDDKTWHVDVEINDIYDFTDFKNLNKYVTSNSSIPMSVFSTILNNFAVVSSEYGVIKPYKVKIKFEINNYEV